MESLEERISAELASYPSIQAALLFGSLAENKARPGSDLDLAVLTSEARPGARRKMMAALMSALSDFSPSGKVDLVFLDEAPPALRQRIMEKGRLLLCRDRRSWAELRERTMREYFDMEPYRRAYIAAQKKRLREGRKSGRSPKIIESLNPDYSSGSVAKTRRGPSVRAPAGPRAGGVFDNTSRTRGPRTPGMAGLSGFAAGG